MHAAPAPRPSRDRLVGLLLLGLAVAGGVLLARRPDATPARPSAGAAILDEEVLLGKEPLVRRLRVAGPANLTVDVAGAPEGTTGSLGPAAPVEQVEAPDPALATTWRTGATPRTLPAFPTGMYVLRIEAPATAAGTRARLRVTRADAP